MKGGISVWLESALKPEKAALPGRRVFKMELGVSRLLEFDHKATLPSGLRKGKGVPVYLREMASMYLKSPSGRRSTTRPRSRAS